MDIECGYVGCFEWFFEMVLTFWVCSSSIYICISRILTSLKSGFLLQKEKKWEIKSWNTVICLGQEGAIKHTFIARKRKAVQNTDRTAWSTGEGTGSDFLLAQKVNDFHRLLRHLLNFTIVLILKVKWEQFSF